MADSLDEWRSFFSLSEHDIFEIIESAFMIAATDFPSEFKEKRDKITEMLFAGKNTKSIGNCEKTELNESKVSHPPKLVVMEMKKNVNESLMSNDDESTCTSEESKLIDEIIKVKAILEKSEEQPNDLILDSLSKLQGMDMTFKALYDTKIGFSVAIYRKHECNDIKTLAKTLIRDWRNFVHELEACNPEVLEKYVKTSALVEEEKRRTSHPLKNENSVHPIKKMAKPPQSNVIQTSEEDASIRSKLQVAKRKLHERYEECENAKRQRSIKVLELKDLPKQTTGQSRKLSNCGRNQTSGKEQGYCFQRKCF